MNERELVEVLRDVLENSDLAELMTGEQYPPVSIRTYEEAGVMTNNNGFVIRAPNGSEFQVTVVRSR